MTKFKSVRQFFVVLCVLYALTENAFGQTSPLENQLDFVEQTEILSQLIVNGSIEQKRDALLQIRNLETEAASRLAVPALRDVVICNS
jgi:hypothetical protein